MSASVYRFVFVQENAQCCCFARGNSFSIKVISNSLDYLQRFVLECSVNLKKQRQLFSNISLRLRLFSERSLQFINFVSCLFK